MGDQVPEIQRVLAAIVQDELGPALGALNDGGGWSVHSHSVTVYNGLLVATFLVGRPTPC